MEVRQFALTWSGGWFRIKKFFVVLFYIVLTVMYAKHTKEATVSLFENSPVVTQQVQKTQKEVTMEVKNMKKAEELSTTTKTEPNLPQRH